MLSGSVKIRLRPLRFAFVVAPDDRSAVLTAIQTTTFLWGGTFNPILPYYRRTPKMWAMQRGIRVGARAVLDGYIEAFDPDFVVPVGKLEKADLKFGNREVINCSEILQSAVDDGVPKLGIGLYEVFKGFADNELKYVRNNPIPFCIPEIKGPSALFYAALFGALPPKLLEEFERSLPGVPGFSRVGCSEDEYLARLQPDTNSFRRLGAWKIEVSRVWQSRADCVYFLDSREPADVIDYWNLRAVGWNIIPVCRRTVAQENVRNAATIFINQHFYPYRGNPSIHNHALLLPSRPALALEAAAFAKSLQLKPSENPHESPLVLCPFYPRIWDAWARGKDQGTPCKLEAGETEVQLSAADSSAKFPSLIPKFARRYGGSDGRRCANEVAVRLWGHERPFAEVVPEGGDTLVRAITDIGLYEWRCALSGLIHFPHFKNSHQPVPLTAAEPVFIAWLKEHGWEAAISDKGHIALQMFRQLGGSFGLSFLAIEGMIEFLSQLARQGPMNEQQYFAGLNRITNFPGNKFGSTARLAQRLVANQMVQLGIQVQCPHCRQRSWYSINDARYDLKCTKCLSDFPLPSHSPKDIKFAYRAIGTFSLPPSVRTNAANQSQGSVTVLLAFHFFVRLTHGATTPLFSFTAKKGTKNLEADLALFFRESNFRESTTELVFCECKSTNAFDARDSERMWELGKAFPGAFLVFVTLNKSLSKAEKKILRPIINRGRKYWKDERPCNPVIILTGNEIFAEFSLESTWRALGGVHARRAQRWNYDNRLLDLADATQEIYLGMPTWHEWLRPRIQMKRRAQGPAPASVPAPAAGTAPQPNQADLTIAIPTQLRQVPFL